MVEIRPASLLLVAVVIVAFGGLAATVDVGEAPEADPSDAPERTTGPDNGTGSGDPASLTCSGPLTDPFFGAAFVGAVLCGAVVLWRWRGSAVPAVAIGGPLLFGATYLCPPQWLAGLLSPLQGGLSMGLPGGLAPSTMVIVATLLAGLVGAVAVLFVFDGDATSIAGEASSGGTAPLDTAGRDTAQVTDVETARTAATNEVYRAWLSMVRRADVPDPATATPAEVRRHAVAAGMDEAAVAELTRLFVAVRYGDRDAAERAERAADALDRLGDTPRDGGDR